MIVDAHQHFWDPARADYPWMTDEVAPLRRRFGPEDLEPLLRAHGVDGTIVVQARHSLDETRELLAIAAATPFVLGVVGWVDLTGDVERQLVELDGALVGIRHQVHDEPDPAWLLRDDVQRGLGAVAAAGLVYDLLVRTRELPAAVETARRQPGLTFVLDHAGKRPEADGEWAGGRGGAGRDCRTYAASCRGSSPSPTRREPSSTRSSASAPSAASSGRTGRSASSRPGTGKRSKSSVADEHVLGGTAIRTYALRSPR